MPILYVPAQSLERIEDQLIDNQLRPEHKVFANGLEANNHLDMGYDEVPDIYRSSLAHHTAALIVSTNVRVSFVAPVPTGANGWGHEVAHDIALIDDVEEPVVLEFEKSDRRVFVNFPETIEKIAELKKQYGDDVTGVVIDDATSDGGTSEALADYLIEQEIYPELIASIFFRGDLDLLQSKYNRIFTIARNIPMNLDWKKYNAEGEITSAV